MSNHRWGAAAILVAAHLAFASEAVYLEMMNDTPPRVEANELSAFDPEDLASVREAFAGATAIAMQQAWLDELEADFRPGIVRTGWRDGALWVFAELEDEDIHNSADGMNQETWSTGDVFEMFLSKQGRENYLELHVTPENQIMQLEWPTRTSIVEMRTDDRTIHDFFVPEPIFQSWTWVHPEEEKWYVLARVPAEAMSKGEALAEGDAWRFSFSRYDTFRDEGRRAVLSSTSPHARRYFHRHEEWGELVFKGDSRSGAPSREDGD